MTELNLRIGLVGPSPPPNGGMAMQTNQLAELLALEGVDVIRLTTNAPYRPKIVGRIRGLRALFRLIPYSLSAWRMAGQVDVIHIMANSGWSWQLFTAPVVWLASIRGTPIIVNYRGGEALDYFRRSFSHVKPTLDKTDHVVVPSEYLNQVFEKFSVPSRVIPNIINRALFFPEENTSMREGFTLIITRNLEPIYGIDMAIKAIALLEGKVAGLKLKIAGSGPQLEVLRVLAENLGVSEIVSFVGRIERDEMCSFYHSAEVMLNPTTVDNMPNSVLEALACGVAVISTRVGGVPYIVEDEQTALLIDSGDEVQMAAAILRLYEDYDFRLRMIAAGLDEVVQYSWPNVKEQWLALYKDTAESID